MDPTLEIFDFVESNEVGDNIFTRYSQTASANASTAAY